MRHFAFLVLLLTITACTNPINRATFNKYMNAGMLAEKDGNLAAAEENYRRAYLNTQMGHLSEEEGGLALARGAAVKMKLGKDSEAQELFKRAESALETAYENAKDNAQAKTNTQQKAELSMCAYNLSLVKRDLCKLDEADRLFQESLAIEQEISSERVGKHNNFISSRVCELAHLNYERGKQTEAVSYFATCVEMVDKDNLERVSPGQYLYVLDEYAQALKATNRLSEAKPVADKVETLKARGISAIAPWNHVQCPK